MASSSGYRVSLEISKIDMIRKGHSFSDEKRENYISYARHTSCRIAARIAMSMEIDPYHTVIQYKKYKTSSQV